MSEQLPEIILIDKPKGITSFDVIRRLRRKYDIKKMGHAGTLDPLASGLLIVGVGKGTKKLHDLIGLPKTYEADILLGVKMSTGDLEGKVIERAAVPSFKIEEIERALDSLVGKLVLPVPIYSAIKIAGQALYKLARRGEHVVPPKKEMEIFSVQLIDTLRENNRLVLSVRMNVSSGTYIRSVAEEVGKRLGVPSTLQGLRRTQIGEFKIEDANKLD